MSIEGEGIDGVTVTLSTGLTTTTSGGGSFRFDGVEAGPYTVTISGLPSDANFRLTSAAVIVHTDGQVHTLDFTGIWFRTSVIRGTVTAENTVDGEGENHVVATDSRGEYTVDYLQAGDYTVTISEYGPEYSFDVTTKSVSVGLRETATVSFEGQGP